jgi:hypothetical protein
MLRTKKIGSLKLYSTFSPASSPKDQIKLTQEQKDELLRGLDEILKISDPMSPDEINEMRKNKINELLDYQEVDKALSIEESFPRLNEGDRVGILNWDWDKIFNTFKLDKLLKSKDSEIPVEEVLKDTGILKGIEILRNNPEYLKNLGNNDALNKCISNLDKFIGDKLNPEINNEIIKSEDNYVKKITESEYLEYETYKGFVELAKKNIEYLKSHDTQVSVGLGVVSFIGCSLAYRALIKSYSVSLYGSNIQLSHQQNLNKIKDVRRFALFFAPLILVGLMGAGYALPSRHKIALEANLEIDSKSSTSGNLNDKIILIFSRFLHKNNKNIDYKDNNILDKSSNRVKLFNYFKLSILILVVFAVILKYIFGINDYYSILINARFTIINSFLIYLNYIKGFLIIWIIVWNMYFIFKYIKFKYYFEIEIINVPKYLPNFFRKIIDDINLISKEQDPLYKNFIRKVVLREAIFIFWASSFYIWFLYYII